MRESMKRGSQGSGGILGYGFNIITGKDDRPGGDPHATLRPRDPRVTRNVTERTDQQVDAWGDAGRRRPDLISGRFRPTVREGASQHTPQPLHSMAAQLLWWGGQWPVERRTVVRRTPGAHSGACPSCLWSVCAGGPAPALRPQDRQAPRRAGAAQPALVKGGRTIRGAPCMYGACIARAAVNGVLRVLLAPLLLYISFIASNPRRVRPRQKQTAIARCRRLPFCALLASFARRASGARPWLPPSLRREAAQ